VTGELFQIFQVTRKNGKEVNREKVNYLFKFYLYMLAYFYHQTCNLQLNEVVTLNTDNSKHIVQVLRKKEGDQIKITNDKGLLARAKINVADKKPCNAQILSIERMPKGKNEIWLAISFSKNRNRTEWLSEKATGLRVDGIIPLHC